MYDSLDPAVGAVLLGRASLAHRSPARLRPSSALMRACARPCLCAQETDENKLIYTDVFRKYTELLEAVIESRLQAAVQGFDMQVSREGAANQGAALRLQRGRRPGGRLLSPLCGHQLRFHSAYLMMLLPPPLPPRCSYA